jgi:hypothetical protein
VVGLHVADVYAARIDREGEYIMFNILRRGRQADFGNTIVVVSEKEKRTPEPTPEKKVDDVILSEKDFKIRLADSDAGRSSASMLINTMYSWRGYGGTHELQKSLNRITLTASDDDKIVGTITLGIDSPVGLLADEIFKDEIDAFRQRGRKVCELTKLAFDPETRSKRVLASLFHIVFIFLHRLHHCTDIFIEVNPRHRLFYEKLLGFTQLGDEKTNTRVNAPAFLLTVDSAYVEEQIRLLGGGAARGSKSRSLYPYFFSTREADGIAGRLRGL